MKDVLKPECWEFDGAGESLPLPPDYVRQMRPVTIDGSKVDWVDLPPKPDHVVGQ